MKQKNPWDRITEINDKGDASPEPIFASIGRATTTWEKMLATFTDVFMTLVGSGDNYALRRAIGSQISAITKADLVLYASRECLKHNEPLRVEAKNLATKVKEFNHRRNDIAHGTLLAWETWHNRQILRHGYYLVPSFSDSTKTESILRSEYGPDFEPWAYRWTSTQIDHYTAHFERLQEEIGQFNKKLWDEQSS